MSLLETIFVRKYISNISGRICYTMKKSGRCIYTQIKKLWEEEKGVKKRFVPKSEEMRENIILRAYEAPFPV